MFNFKLVVLITMLLSIESHAANPKMLNENEAQTASKSAIIYTAPKLNGILVRKYNHPDPVPSEAGASGYSMLLGYTRFLSPADLAGQHEKVLKLNGGVAKHNLIGTRRLLRFDSERSELTATVATDATQLLMANNWQPWELIQTHVETQIKQGIWLEDIAFTHLSEHLKKPTEIVVKNASKDLTITIEPLLEISVDMSTVILSGKINVYRSPLADLGDNPNKSKVRSALKSYRAKPDYAAMTAVFMPWGEPMSYMRRERSEEEKEKLKANLKAHYTPLYNAETKKGKKRKISEAYQEEKQRVDERYGYVESDNFMGRFWLDNNGEYLGKAILQARELLPNLITLVISGGESPESSKNITYNDSSNNNYERVLIATLPNNP